MELSLSPQITLALILTTCFEITGYQNAANVDDGDAGNLEDHDHQQIQAHVAQFKVLPLSDIQQVLAAQHSQKTQKLMQKDPGKAKKTITIDGVVYTANVHNTVYSKSTKLISSDLFGQWWCQLRHGR